MATKKSQPRTQPRAMPTAQSQTLQDMIGTPTMWKWLYVGGVVIAGLTGAFGFENVILSWVLLIVGLLVGFLYFDPADIMNFGLRYLILGALATASATFLGFTGAAGSYVTGFLMGFFNFLGPVVLAMAIMHFSKKYFGNPV